MKTINEIITESANSVSKVKALEILNNIVNIPLDFNTFSLSNTDTLAEDGDVKEASLKTNKIYFGIVLPAQAINFNVQGFYKLKKDKDLQVIACIDGRWCGVLIESLIESIEESNDKKISIYHELELAAEDTDYFDEYDSNNINTVIVLGTLKF